MHSSSTFSEAQRKFRNELFYSVEAQPNFPNQIYSTNLQHFSIQLKRNLTSPIKFTAHDVNSAILRTYKR